ncbi:response regulator transcription factor [Azospirillum picis]|uniref:DNA-binding response OmpR family regulator n=1 Tax=Azospirillum picis TaxID=488438 RepID=A0ABU0MRL7_9PROT|nr:response regulator transcription factor [Azospirillum picis]MBP2300871.1 DNA-binding response OmpR family regulator [Azospirillum picis]MDQ0536128.1 DNA-binding response OmpR family regulator [Azospirillum picis]
MARIAIVEDEAALREDIALYLRAEGHDVLQAGSGAELDALATDGADIVVLDVNLPGESGFAIAARLRRSSNMGIIMLTARRLEDDRLTGLDAGADIYLAKPVSLRELAAHVRALDRRLSREAPLVETPPSWQLDRTAWRLLAPSGSEIRLSNLELRFLVRLAESPDAPVSRNQMALAIYGTCLDHDSRALDALIRRLKNKVERLCGAPLPVQVLYASGYVFSAPLRVVPASTATE